MPAYVNSASVNDYGTALITYSPTAGNTVILTCWANDTTPSDTSISITGASSSLAVNISPSSPHVVQGHTWIVANCPSGITAFTFTNNQAANIMGSLIEVTGDTQDTTPVYSGTDFTGTTVSSGTITTSAASTILVGSWVCGSNFTASNPTSSFTIAPNANAGRVAFSYRAVTAAGSYSTTIDFASSFAADDCVLIAIKSSGGGGGGGTVVSRLGMLGCGQ